MPQPILERIMIDLLLDLIIIVDWYDGELQVVAMLAAVTMSYPLDHPKGRHILEKLVGILLTLVIALLIHLLERESLVCVLLELALRQHADVAKVGGVEVVVVRVGRFENCILAAQPDVMVVVLLRVRIKLD